ncbi:hypothetical protein AAFF_G00320120 [Aldrovandia affinis]|uniref:Zinc transporter ZIP11 n=1 Tax=Aldrovandia affinis TaxID=143900 RepID=A0AAD7VZP0_9TELE|nr:hypothetical protein AAFF_G00320120 [Aldrovandia affinis]
MSFVWNYFTEGLAIGVGFGAIGKTPSATFESARNLAIGIGIQNFPEGLAVSLPLRAFATGAMMYVVIDDIIPEAQVSGNGKLTSWTSILGFLVMMSLDVGLG